SHSHSNMSVLNNLTSSVINNSHTHSNKTYLDIIDQNLSKNSHPEFDLIRIKGKLDFRTYSEEHDISIYNYNNDAFYYLYGTGNTWHRFRNSDFEDICVFRSSKECYFYGYGSFLAGASGASSIRYKKNIQNIDYEILKE